MTPFFLTRNTQKLLIYSLRHDTVKHNSYTNVHLVLIFHTISTLFLNELHMQCMIKNNLLKRPTFAKAISRVFLRTHVHQMCIEFYNHFFFFLSYFNTHHETYIIINYSCQTVSNEWKWKMPKGFFLWLFLSYKFPYR